MKEDTAIEEIVLNPTLDLYKELFNIRTKEWKYWMKHNDHDTAGSFDDLLNKLEPYKAFESIKYIVDLLHMQLDKDLFITCLSLLLDMVKVSNTTEIPDELKNNLKLIEIRVKELNEKDATLLFDGIKEWYRE